MDSIRRARTPSARVHGEGEASRGRAGAPGARHAWIRALVSAALVAGLLLSPGLWLTRAGGDPIPMTPAWDPLGALAPPHPFDLALFGALLFALVAAAVLPSGRWRPFAGAALALCALLALADQTRWQPWLYQYAFMLAALVFCREGAALNACRLVVAATYFWSGLQKANASFRQDGYPWLMEPFAGLVPGGYEAWISVGAHAVPAVEAAIGLGLLAGRTRPFAVAGAVLMHGFIMASIGPWGHDWNTVVWPWNLAMVAFVLVLFVRPGALDAPTALSILLPGRSAVRWAVLVLFAFAPLLSFWDRWDSYLSASLYSENTKRGVMVELGRKGAEPVHTDLILFGIEELNAPVYPEEKVLTNVARARCRAADRPGRTAFVLLQKPDVFGGERDRAITWCRDLLADRRGPLLSENPENRRKPISQLTNRQ